MTILYLPAHAGIQRNHYRVIYADPPWEFSVWGKSNGRNASDKYPVLDRSELMKIPVGDYAADDSVLMMWATWPNLLDALAVGQAWGFTYKTCGFDWVKQSTTGKSWHMGMGYYTRSCTEPCLLFTKGNPKRKDKGVPMLLIDDELIAQPSLFPPIVSPVMGHSAKPLEGYERIERLFDGPYLELFSRNRRKGWDAVGNQIDGRDIRDVLRGAA